MKFNLTWSHRLRAVGFLALIFLPKPLVMAAELSANLTRDDLHKQTSILSMGSIHRAWSAHNKEGGPLGLNVGLESSFLFRRDLIESGNGDGIVPKTIPIPRLWFGWDLDPEVKLSASYAPGALFDGISALGLGAQWLFYEDDERGASSSVLVHYTYSDAFGDLSAHTWGVAGQITRDLSVWQPYAGAGLLFNAATIKPELMAASLGNTEKRLALHLYFGARVDLAAKLAFQVDLADLKPALSILLSNSF